MGPSGRFNLNTTDYKKWLRACLVWLAPLGILYFGSVLALLQVPKHVFSLQDLIPSTIVINGAVLYVIERFYDLSRRFIASGY